MRARLNGDKVASQNDRNGRNCFAFQHGRGCQMLRFAILLHTICVVADSAFRFGAVLSTVGDTATLTEAKNGYELYFNAVNAENDGRGFELEGKKGTESFFFHFEFLWHEDMSDEKTHERRLRDLIQKDKVHFLGGSHPAYAEREMRIANKFGILNYQCCVGPDYLYEQDYPTVFGIQASNRQYTNMLIRTLQLRNVTAVEFVYQEDNPFTRTTCEAAEVFFHEFDGVRGADSRGVVRHRFNTTLTHTTAREAAKEAKLRGTEAVVACVFPADGKRLVQAFHEIRYPLRAFFLTTGPTKQEWVDDFNPPSLANDLLSAGQWHPGMNYSDAFFGSTSHYTEMYRDNNEGLMATYVSAGASAVGLTLTQAIREAFRGCDISATGGDVDVLLYNATAIKCDRWEIQTGYQRILHALSALVMKETFFGGVEFNEFRRNVALQPVTTQIFERKEGNKTYREIAAVLPHSYSSEVLKYPATNRYTEKCKPGYFIGPDAFDPCQHCAQGEFSDRSDADHCERCQKGTWTDQLAQQQCKPCPEGTHTIVPGASKKRDCVCKPGFFNSALEAGVECEPCPEGAICQGGVQPPIPRRGYWADESQRHQMYSCDPLSSCLGGESVACEEGRTGR